MAISYWCVFVAAILPYVWTLSYRWPGYTRQKNLAPRDYQQTLVGWRRRAHWAHLNGLETFPTFAAVVIIAHQLAGPQPTVDTLSIAYVLFRVAHGVFYVLDIGLARTFSFFMGQFCVIGIFFTLL